MIFTPERVWVPAHQDRAFLRFLAICIGGVAVDQDGEVL